MDSKKKHQQYVFVEFLGTREMPFFTLRPFLLMKVSDHIMCVYSRLYTLMHYGITRPCHTFSLLRDTQDQHESKRRQRGTRKEEKLFHMAISTCKMGFLCSTCSRYALIHNSYNTQYNYINDKMTL